MGATQHRCGLQYRIEKGAEMDWLPTPPTISDG